MRDVRIESWRDSTEAENSLWAQYLLGSFRPNQFRPIEATENSSFNKGNYHSQSWYNKWACGHLATQDKCVNRMVSFAGFIFVMDRIYYNICQPLRSSSQPAKAVRKAPYYDQRGKSLWAWLVSNAQLIGVNLWCPLYEGSNFCCPLCEGSIRNEGKTESDVQPGE